MNRALLSKRISSLLAEVSRLSNALCAMNTMDLQRYPENYELLSTDAALRAEQIACRMRHLVYGFTTVQKHEYLTSAANVLGITITAQPGLVEITLPGLLPKKKQRSAEYLTDPLGQALGQFVGMCVWSPPHGSGPRRSIRPAPRLPRSARRRSLRRRTSTSGTTSWLRRVSSAHWCVPLSTEIRKKEPLHKLCGGSFCVHDEVKNKISAEHAQSECGGHLNRKDVTSYLPSRSGCGCDGPASPPQRCSRRRWAQ